MIAPDPPSRRNLRATHPSSQLQGAIFVRLDAEELPAKPSSESPVAPRGVDGGLIATIAQIELEISSLDKQRQALKMAVEILRQLRWCSVATDFLRTR